MSVLGIARPRGRHRRLSPSEVTALHRQKDAATVAAIQLDAAGIRLSGALWDLEEAQREITSLKAALANATSITPRPATRDIDPDDQPTSPTGINVRPLWDALGIVPGNTSPAHIPGL